MRSLKILLIAFLIFVAPSSAFAANRYWVGGAASWDATAGTKWALTTGGAGGQAVPTSADDCFFDGASGAVTVTIVTATANCHNLDFTVFTGTLAGSTAINIAGNLTLGSGMTRTYTGAISFTATAATSSIKSNGILLGSNVTFNGAGGGWQFSDDFNTTGSILITKGGIDWNGFTSTSSVLNSAGCTVSCQIYLRGGTANVTLTSGTPVSLTSAFLTIVPGTSTLVMAGQSTSVQSRLLNTIYPFYNFRAYGSGSFTTNSATTLQMHDMDFSRATTTTFEGAASGVIVTGSLTLASTMTKFFCSQGHVSSTTEAVSITYNGANLMGTSCNTTWQFLGTGSWTLQDDINWPGQIGLDQGTFNANNKNLKALAFTTRGSNGDTPTVNMGSGTWEIPTTAFSGFFDFRTTGGGVMTLNSQTSTIKYNPSSVSTTVKNFNGGGRTYNNIWITGSATNAQINDSNTFNDFKVDSGPRDVFFAGGSTTTIASLTISANSASTVSLKVATSSQQFYMASPTGSISTDYIYLKGSNAVAGTTWNAGCHSTNAGNNTGWTFPCTAKFFVQAGRWVLKAGRLLIL